MDAVVVDPGEDIDQVLAGVDPVLLAGLEDREQGRQGLAPALIAHEGPVLAAHANPAQGAFAAV